MLSLAGASGIETTMDQLALETEQFTGLRFADCVLRKPTLVSSSPEEAILT